MKRVIILGLSLLCTQGYATEKKQLFHLVKDGVPQCVILLDDKASISDQDGAEELNHWVANISGKRLPVRKASEWDRQTPYIAIGESAITKSNGWATDRLGFEEASIIIEENRIGLLGSRAVPESKVVWPQSFNAIASRKWPIQEGMPPSGPGSYYATLDFLQKSLGARWIWPGSLGEVYTPSKTISVSITSWKWTPPSPLVRSMRAGYRWPAKEYEKLFGKKVPETTIETLDRSTDQWRRRERMNRPEPLVFSPFQSWWGQYFKEHPEWFAKAPEGRKALTGGLAKFNLSHPGFQQQVVKNWENSLKGDPSRKYYINISPNDLKGFDVRPESRALDAPEMASLTDEEIWMSDKPILSDRYVYFWNNIAGRLAESSPETKILALAYDRFRKPPLKSTPINKNVIVFYVGGEGFYPDEHYLADEFKRWATLGASLVWRPNLLHCGHGIPYLFSKQLYSDLKAFHGTGLLGTDYDSLIGNWATQGLNYYIAAELQNRPEASYEELSGEYFSAFGEAQDAIAKYHVFFEDLTKEKAPLLRDKQIVQNESWGKFWRGHMRFVAIALTDEALAKGSAILAEAEKAVKNDPVASQRVAFLREGFEHSKLMAETFRSIGLDKPDQPLRLEDTKLAPLWNARQKLIGNLSSAILTQINHEQVQFNLWGDYMENTRMVEQGIIRRPLSSPWHFQALPAATPLPWDWPSHAAQGPEWKEIASLATAETGANKNTIQYYHTSFEMPLLPDEKQYAILEIKGVHSDLHLWINGRLTPINAHRFSKESAPGKRTLTINILEYVEQGKSCQVAISTRGENSPGTGFADSVALLTRF